ncbi:MAG: radical SAM protein, partial [Pyrinomonadaceae bacterium]
LTPLPGSEDHKKLYESGVAMDEDLNKYDLNHDVTGHPNMSREEWRETYHAAWETYYTDDHVETVLRRAIATGTSAGKTMFFIVWFKGCLGIEKIHPLEGGFFRRKNRKNRRPGMPLENAFLFYPGYLAETLRKQFSWISLYTRMRMIYRRVKHDPQRLNYMDIALEPVTDHEEERELFQTDAAQGYLEKAHRIERLSRGETV